MGRFRSIIRKAVKPFAMAAVAGALALSLVITTPSNARAFGDGGLVSAPVLAGATRMAIPTLMATSSILGPVGWTIAGVGLLGIGLYASRDYWWPYVTGAFGSGSSDTSVSGGTTANGYGQINQHYHLLSIAAAGTTGRSVQITQNYAQNSSGVSLHLAVRYVCESNTAPGSFSEVKSILTHTANITSTNNLAPSTLSCNAGFTIRGVEAGLAGDGQLPKLSGQPSGGPVEHLYWGTLVTGSFDPRSPEVSYKTTVECIRSDGTKFSTSATSAGDAGAVKVPSCEAVEAGSHGTGQMLVEGFPPGSTVGKTIWSATAPTIDPNKPACSPGTPGSGCKLAVKIDGQECLMGLFDCEHWTDLRDSPTEGPRVSCQYGPYAVPIETCNPLERAYEEGGAPATEENTDGNPNTRRDTDPNGNQIPKTSTDPGLVPGAAGTPASGDAAAQGCFPGGWAILNPMWIVDGIRCSFIPKTDITARVTTLQATAETKAPLTWFSPNITGPGGGGCPNWVVTMPGFSQNVICGQGFTNAILGVRAPLFGLLSAAMVWPLIRSLWYAAIPIMRVAPSSGGKD